MALLCILMVGGTYFGMRTMIFNQSQQILQIIASQAGSSVLNQNLRHQYLTRYFYVKIDGFGNIIERSPDTPVNDEQLSVLLHSVEKRKSPRGQVSINDEDYNYLKGQLSGNNDQLLSFVSIDHDQDTLWFLLIILSIVGLVYLVLAYFGGRFLATRAMEPITESWQRQQNFVADASHELRTPLAVIQTNIELVKGNPHETVAEQMKWLDYIDLETKRLTKLVDDLLFLARADSNKQAIEIKELNLSEVITQTVALFRAFAEKKGVLLNANILDEVRISGDEQKLRQLVLILLDNALKHSQEGSQIKIELDRYNNGGRIMVIDHGEGISPEHLTHIFDRFYRVDKARSKQAGGTGLGLAIAQSIAQMHRGTIIAKSIPGQETVFTVTLPHKPGLKEK